MSRITLFSVVLSLCATAAFGADFTQSEYDNAVKVINDNISDSTADNLYYAMSDIDALRVRICEDTIAKTVRVKSGADAHKVCVIAITAEK